MKVINSLQVSCINYIKNNINALLISPTERYKLYSLSDKLLVKLAEKFSNRDAEKVIDNIDDEEQEDIKERFEAIFYCNLIASLTLPKPEIHRGHYSSLYDVYKCINCSKIISTKLSDKIQCINNYITINRLGEIVRLHEIDMNWNLTKYIDTMRNEFKYSWRNVYWRAWSECHYLFCVNCKLFYSVYDYDKCYYHSASPVFQSNNKDDDFNKLTTVEQLKCCGKKAYLYNCVELLGDGCCQKPHVPFLKSNNTTNIVNIFKSYKSLMFDDNLEHKTSYNDKTQFENNGLRLRTVNRNAYRKGLIGKLSDKVRKTQLEKLKQCQSAVNPPQRCHSTDKISRNINDIDNLMTDLKTQSSYAIGSTNKKRRNASKLFKSTTVIPEKLKMTNYLGYEKLIMSMEASSHRKDNYCKNINPKYGSKVDETQFYNEGCCLPLQEINTEEKYFNKPIQYTKKAHKHKKMKCGIQSKQWHSKFSTRYNQDKQRECEDNIFVFINSWLTENTDSIDALTDEQIVHDYLINCNNLSLLKNCNDYNENDEDGKGFSTTSSSVDSYESKSCNSVSSYCSTINSAVRVHHSRTTTVWNSFIPLAGSFIRIETEWRDGLDNNLISSYIQSNKNNFDNNSGNMLLSKFCTRLKSRCKYPYYRNIQMQYHNNRQRSFKYKGQNTFMTMKRKTLEIPLTNYAEDYNRIWYYDRYSHELDYLSATYMPVPNCKQYRSINSDLQNEWEDMLNLEKSWSGFLKLFSENESLPKNDNDNLIQRNIKSYHSLYNLYTKIDFKNAEETNRSKSSDEIVSNDLETVEGSDENNDSDERSSCQNDNN